MSVYKALLATTMCPEWVPKMGAVGVVKSACVQANKKLHLDAYNVEGMPARYVSSAAKDKGFTSGLVLALVQYSVGSRSALTASDHDHSALWMKLHAVGPRGRQSGQGDGHGSTSQIGVVWDPLASASRHAPAAVRQLMGHANNKARIYQYNGTQRDDQHICAMASTAKLIELVQWMSDNPGELAQVKTAHDVARKFFGTNGVELLKQTGRV